MARLHFWFPKQKGATSVARAGFCFVGSGPIRNPKPLPCCLISRQAQVASSQHEEDTPSSSRLDFGSGHCPRKFFQIARRAAPHPIPRSQRQFTWEYPNIWGPNKDPKFSGSYYKDTHRGPRFVETATRGYNS